MSYQVGLACYSTAQQAAQAVASASGGSLVTHAGGAYLVEVGTVTGSGIEYLLHPVGGGAPVVLASGYAPVPCNLLTAADGLQIGWMVFGVWAAVWGVMFLARALWVGDKGSDYGNA